MRKRPIRTLSALSLAGIVSIAGSGVAQAFTASYGYTLSGNGRMEYDKSANQLKLLDYKNGDYIYARYGFTNTPDCGSSGNACAPSAYSTYRLTSSSANATGTITVDPGGKGYILLKLCNDDLPPDTCSEWKRTAA